MSKIVTELQMVTGVVSDDLEYLVSLLLAGGSYVEESTKQEEQNLEPELVELDKSSDFEEWFKRSSSYEQKCNC